MSHTHTPTHSHTHPRGPALSPVHRPSVLLGVTNPFFVKTFQKWPHVVRLGETKMAGKQQLLLLLCFLTSVTSPLSSR